ncbi:hypothetical protein D9758_009444 [Tetrapyrgos nigripes]|uniref:Uncharacterized protein n=1 Tax=Tetrapyrgos nigripes TaxID=182062 RepID=A0A8H5D2U9_9AGAR|nr:hypothetical protein D9758_009444 [Tetrapyrgos nigripes]
MRHRARSKTVLKDHNSREIMDELYRQAVHLYNAEHQLDAVLPEGRKKPLSLHGVCKEIAYLYHKETNKHPPETLKKATLFRLLNERIRRSQSTAERGWLLKGEESLDISFQSNSTSTVSTESRASVKEEIPLQHPTSRRPSSFDVELFAPSFYTSSRLSTRESSAGPSAAPRPFVSRRTGGPRDSTEPPDAPLPRGSCPRDSREPPDARPPKEEEDDVQLLVDTTCPPAVKDELVDFEMEADQLGEGSNTGPASNVDAVFEERAGSSGTFITDTVGSGCSGDVNRNVRVKDEPGLDLPMPLPPSSQPSESRWPRYGIRRMSRTDETALKEAVDWKQRGIGGPGQKADKRKRTLPQTTGFYCCCSSNTAAAASSFHADSPKTKRHTVYNVWTVKISQTSGSFHSSSSYTDSSRTERCTVCHVWTARLQTKETQNKKTQTKKPQTKRSQTKGHTRI